MSKAIFIQTDHLQKAQVAPFLCRVVPVCEQTGFTPMVSAASLADAQAEIARLRGALEKAIAEMEDDLVYIEAGEPGTCDRSHIDAALAVLNK